MAPLGRKPPRHTLLYLPETMACVGEQTKSWDDELDFNTQDSSQWDILCHVHHLPSGLVYNGFSPDNKALAAPSTAENQMPTLDHWHERGCIAARSLLLDYKAFAEQTALPFHPLDGTAHFGLVFRPGDVLVVRTGTVDVLGAPTAADLQRLGAGRMSGLEGSEDMARWLWNKRFAAVASDTFALEAYTELNADGSLGSLDKLVLHHYLLGLFGIPIGEL